MADQISAEREIAAPAADIFQLLCSPAGHVAIDSSGMLQSASGASVTAVGDEFLVHMDRESLGDRPLGKYDITVSITAFEPDQHLEWSVSSEIRPPLGHTYGYRLQPTGTGTLVTSYCDWSNADPARLATLTMPIVPQTSLRASLGILARTVEQHA